MYFPMLFKKEKLKPRLIQNFSAVLLQFKCHFVKKNCVKASTDRCLQTAFEDNDQPGVALAKGLNKLLN